MFLDTLVRQCICSVCSGVEGDPVLQPRSTIEQALRGSRAPLSRLLGGPRHWLLSSLPPRYVQKTSMCLVPPGIGLFVIARRRDGILLILRLLGVQGWKLCALQFSES